MTQDIEDFLKWTEQFDEPLDIEGAYQEHLANAVASDHQHSVVVNHVRVLRTDNPTRIVNDTLSGSQIVVDAVREYLKDKDDVEHMFAIILDNALHTLHVHHISQGTVNACLVDAHSVLRAALILNSKAVLLLHTHPSGNITPSHDDFAITRRLVQACKIMEIRMLDHIVLDKYTGKYHSMSETGKIQEFYDER